jgi:hypothetical protein
MNLQNLIGFILPPFIDLINTKITNDKLKFWVSMLFCVVVGIVINLDKLNNLQELLGSLAIVFATAQVTYKTYWEKSVVRTKVTAALK